MNIIEAAKALQEGKSVTRKSIAGKPQSLTDTSWNDFIDPNYAESIRAGSNGIVLTNTGAFALISVDALLTDEWEIVDE